MHIHAGLSCARTGARAAPTPKSSRRLRGWPAQSPRVADEVSRYMHFLLTSSDQNLWGLQHAHTYSTCTDRCTPKFMYTGGAGQIDVELRSNTSIILASPQIGVTLAAPSHCFHHEVCRPSILNSRQVSGALSSYQEEKGERVRCLGGLGGGPCPLPTLLGKEGGGGGGRGVSQLIAHASRAATCCQRPVCMDGAASLNRGARCGERERAELTPLLVPPLALFLLQPQGRAALVSGDVFGRGPHR